ncbi:heat shock 70 kDa protein cognate 4-like [Culicoides brevitarsis]|uniref:heat shock 70 kDa protein cognate 4-like n=1 Tax=Culicoides brevitarsis TaxID=469753 RepID=UPI00307BBC4C
MTNASPAIGIDLGTSYSVIAIHRNDAVEIIPNSQGNRVTPSCVAFTRDERLIGEGAIYQAPNNAENTIYAAKRLIGRKFDDEAIQGDIKKFPFCVMEADGQMKIKVNYRNQEPTFFPEQISAMVLEKLKEDAEAFLGHAISNVVITCPAYFNDEQRKATTSAANIAGLNVLRLINEPTAAALAYGMNVQNVGRKNVLIFDFGGGTFDVSILTMKDKDYKVRAIKGDTHLGGEDIDQRMVEYFTEEFQRKFDRDISGSKNLLRSLKTQCERAKVLLSQDMQAPVTLAGTSLTGTISRARFEDLNNDLFEKAIDLVAKALRDAEMTKDEINEVVLVGGSSRIPRVQELLQEFFDGKELNKSVHPDECVAYGAAVQAAMLQKATSERMKGLTLIDVCPLSLGIELCDESFSVIIPRNHSLPVKKIKTFYTTFNNQTWTDVEIFEGERPIARANHFLGHFALDGIPPAPKGAKVNVEFEIDENGILLASAIEPRTGKSSKITILNKTRLSKEDAARALKVAEQMKQEDAATRQRFAALHELEQLCTKIRGDIQLVAEENRERVLEKVIEMLEWAHLNRYSAKEAIEEKKNELEIFFNNFSRRI